MLLKNLKILVHQCTSHLSCGLAPVHHHYTSVALQCTFHLTFVTFRDISCVWACAIATLRWRYLLRVVFWMCHTCLHMSSWSFIARYIFRDASSQGPRHPAAVWWCLMQVRLRPIIVLDGQGSIWHLSWSRCTWRTLVNHGEPLKALGSASECPTSMTSSEQSKDKLW